MKKQLTALCMAAAMMVSTAVIAQDDRDDRDDRGDFHLDETYDISATGTLHLNSEDADVRIVGSNRSDVHVKIDRVQASADFDLKRETDSREEYTLSGGSAEIEIRVNDGRVRLSKK